MPSKRRNVKQPPAATAPPPTAASLSASAAAAVTQAALAAQAAAATADSAVKTATAAASPTASAVSDAAAAVHSAIAAYQTVAAALAALHDSLAVSTVPTPLAAPPQPSAAVVVAPPPLRELLPGHSWCDWMPATVLRRLLVLAGIDPDASRWGTIPYELQLMILKAAGPLTLFINGLLGDNSSLNNATIEALWTDVIAQDWQGDLDLLPDVRFNAGKVDMFERPAVDALSLPVTRSMYGRLRTRFPDQASMYEDGDEAFDNYLPDDELYDELAEPDAPLLRHVPMRNGWFDLVDFRYPLTLGWWSIKFGHVGLLKHLAVRYGIDLRMFIKYEQLRAMDLAATYGHLDILQILHHAGNMSCTYRAMDSAAAGGHLDVVQWLHANRREGCTTKAMDNAAYRGHLGVVQFLHANRTEGCTKRAMDDAAQYGHLEVVQSLHANRREGCTTKAMDNAATYGRLNVVQFLHANRTEGCTVRAMNYAALSGCFEIVQWLHANRREGCTTEAMDFAADGGHLDIVQWLHANRTEGCTVKAINIAANRSHLEVVRFLVERGYPFTFDALRYAATAAILGVLVDSLSLARANEMLQIARRTGGLTNLVARLERAVAEKQA